MILINFSCRFLKSIFVFLFLCVFLNVTKALANDNFLGFGKSELKNDIDELIRKGDSLREKKDFKNSIEVFNKALMLAAEENLSDKISYIYKNVGGIYYKLEQYEKAKYYYRKGILRDSLSQNVADSHFNLALVFRKQKVKDSLLFHLHRSLGIYEVLEDTEGKFSTYSKAGIILKNSGDYDSALIYLIKAYEGYSDFENLPKLASVCNSIGAVQRALGNLEISKKYYLKALKIRQKLGDTIKLSYGFNNLANLYKAQKKYDSAIHYYNKAIELQKELESTKELGKYHYNLGTVYFLQKDLDPAVENYQKSVRYKKQEGDSISLTNSYNELAIIEIERKHYNRSKQYLDSASTFLNPNQNRDVLLRHYEVQTAYHKSIKNFEKALNYQQLYSKLYETLFAEKQINVIQELQERFETRQKNQRIAELAKGQGLQKKIITKQKQRIRTKNLLIFIFVILLGLALAIYFLMKQKQKFKEKGLELHRLESIFEGQEIMKERISKDLHDIITTSYDGIRLKILALPKTKEPEKVSEGIVREISSINDEIRFISHRISPLGNKIKETPLSEIIISQLTEFQYFRKTFVNIQMPLPSEIDEFKIESQTNLYGILLEALNNIEKHSQATEVSITHSQKGDTITLLILDNGIGFQKKDKNGIGILNMKQRALLLHGECLVTSSEMGTEVQVIFPIKPNLI